MLEFKLLKKLRGNKKNETITSADNCFWGKYSHHSTSIWQFANRFTLIRQLFCHSQHAFLTPQHAHWQLFGSAPETCRNFDFLMHPEINFGVWKAKVGQTAGFVGVAHALKSSAAQPHPPWSWQVTRPCIGSRPIKTRIAQISEISSFNK